MNTKKLTLSALFLAIGFILHQLMPGVLGSMKPDTFLAMMFVAILICDDYKTTLVVGLASGVLTALTTTFPGGQLPNIIDKVITSQIVFLMLQVLKSRVNNQMKMIVVAVVGTLISGTIFLSSALVIFGQLPLPFPALMVGVVLPAMISNTVLVLFITNVILSALGKASFKFN